MTEFSFLGGVSF